MKPAEQDEPFLSGIPPEAPGHPFMVPDRYFEQFPLRMSEVLPQKRQSQNWIPAWFLRPVPLMAACTLLILFTIAGYRMLQTAPEQTGVAGRELQAYIEQEGIIDEIDTDEILAYTAFVPSGSAPEQTAIQDYLLDEGIELNDIINEF